MIAGVERPRFAELVGLCLRPGLPCKGLAAREGGLDALLTDAARARKHARERGYISIEGVAADEGKSERIV